MLVDVRWRARVKRTHKIKTRKEVTQAAHESRIEEIANSADHAAEAEDYVEEARSELRARYLLELEAGRGATDDQKFNAYFSRRQSKIHQKLRRRFYRNNTTFGERISEPFRRAQRAYNIERFPVPLQDPELSFGIGLVTFLGAAITFSALTGKETGWHSESFTETLKIIGSIGIKTAAVVTAERVIRVPIRKAYHSWKAITDKRFQHPARTVFERFYDRHAVTLREWAENEVKQLDTKYKSN